MPISILLPTLNEDFFLRFKQVKLTFNAFFMNDYFVRQQFQNFWVRFPSKKKTFATFLLRISHFFAKGSELLNFVKMPFNSNGSAIKCEIFNEKKNSRNDFREILLVTGSSVNFYNLPCVRKTLLSHLKYILNIYLESANS